MSVPRRIVLDASAVLAWLLRENGHDVVDKLLPVAVIPASALVESLYRASERGHTLAPAQLRIDLLGMGITIEAVTDGDTVRAAELIIISRNRATAKQASSLSLGDGLCLAVAERLNLPISGGDQHWETLDLRVEYLPFR